MLISWKRTVKATLLCLSLGLTGLASNQANAGLILSYEAVGVQASTVQGVTTETFNNINTGQYTSLSTNVGTFSSPGLAVLNADQYGGAGNSGHYVAIGSQSGTLTASLALNGSQSYFGFWWSAADTLNGVDFYSGGKLLGSFSAAATISALGSAFNGNPNGGGDTGEKFAYLNFTGTNGTTIDQVVFKNTSTATGFEADNFSVRSAALAGPSGTVIANGFIPNVPEPSSLVMASIGGLMGLGCWVRTRRRAKVQA